MTDRAYEPASDDPLAQLAHSEVAPDSSTQPDPDDPLAALARQDGAPQGSSTGAFVRGAEKSVVPALGSFPAIGAGAEVGRFVASRLIGAETGAEVGAEAGTAAEPGLGTAVGGLIGGALGMFGAGYVLNKAQDWAIKQLPDSWQDKLGLSDRQQQIDEGDHPVASFLGGLTPYALTMRPWATEAEKLAAAKLPDNATALQRILAHPATARLFGGAAMGGMELGQEKAEDPNISWPKVAIATAFGMVFNRPTRFGEKITELGAQPARAVLGRPSPTLAQAADAKVMGPGVTEDVFQGTQGQDPVAEGTAQETARQEAATIGTGTETPPDLHAAARAANPELFAHYDDLLARQRTLQDWFGEGSPVAREHLTATENQIEQVAPEVAAAYRRAAEGAGVATVPGEPFPNMAAMLAARGLEAPPVTPGTSAEALPRPIGAQRDYIRDDVARQLVAAGRPAQEAQAAGAVVAARYEARASRFGGALGSAEELYNREGAEIRGAKAPPPEAPPTAAVPTPTPPLSPVGAEEQPAVTAPATRRGPAYRDQNTFSLLEFLAAHGGIRSDDPLAADLRQSFGGKNKFVPGFGQLIRKPNGNRPGAPLSLDQARQAAVDAGYIQDAGEISRGVTQSNIEDLLQAVDKEARGEKVYRQGAPTKTPLPDVAEANVREREAFIQELNDYAKDHLALTPAEHARALELFDKEGIHEAAEIVDRLALELDNREIESGQAGPRDEAIPGWDVPYEREGSQATGEAIAPREPGEPGGGAARTGGEGAREQEVEYFQHKKGQRNLSFEREAEGQQNLPGTERISDAELAQRKANEPLKPTAEQKPMDEGLFGTSKDQREMFQRRYTRDQLERMDIDDLDRMAYGHVAGERLMLNPKEINIKYAGDMENPRDKFEKGGMGWVRSVDRSEPVQVSIGQDGKFYLEDGHHRWFAAQKLGQPIIAEIEKIDGKPIETILQRQGREFNQQQLGKIRLGGQKPIITLARTADASTFIHESGHAWLEELMRDANHPQAPEDLKTDASTVLNWLGAGKVKAQPPKPGMIRYYHGTSAETAEDFTGKTFVAPQEDYARNYRGGPNNVLYFDIPKDEAFARGLYDDINNYPRSGSIDDGAQRLKPLESSAPITTRQHEKFARGFEQYLREGVAPSPQLASVFAKFRDWLLRIYQNLRGLGDEISPPIRDVFDRMLAASPQRTVIAPERMERPTLSDIHEADAAHTHPTEAEPIRDRVVAETTSFVQDLPGALQNELATEFARTEPAAEPGTETSGGPEQRGSLGPGGGESQPVAAGGAGGAERGAELPGGGGAEPESVAEPAGGERPGGAKPTDAGLGDKPLAPRPGAFIQGQESKFTDKAGNIRLDTLTNDVDVRQAIKDSARENNDFIGDRRGVVTDGQVMDLAADLGMEGAEKLVKDRVIGQAFNAEQVMALRKLLIQSATDVSGLMKQADTGTDADLMAYAKAKARHQMIQGTVAQATAEAGRALRAFRNIAGTEGQADINEFLKAATGKTLFQLRQEVRLGATLDTPQKVSKFINDAQDRSFGRMILEYWINGLISGPATHATYMIGNTLLALEKAGPETAAASAIGRLRTAMGRSGETVRMGEVAEQIKAGVRGFTPAVKAALDAFRSGVTTMLPGEQAAQNILRFPGQELAAAPMLDEAAKLSDVITSGYSVVRGMRDGLIAGGEIAKAGENAPRLLYSTTGVIPDVRIGGAVLPVGSIIRAPSRFIAAIHSFFRAVNYSMEKNRLAYRMGMNEGLTGTALDSRIGELRQNPSDAMMEQARGEATELTLMGQGGAITQALARLTNTPIFGFPLLKFIDPFVHISSNIINQSIIERTPLGVLSPEIRADLMGKNGNVAQDTAMARMLMGSIYAITLGGLAAEGYVSGSEPADKNQAAIWRMAGNQAHSVRIGDMWYDVHRLGPLGMLLGVAADMQSVSHAISDGDLILAGSNLQHAITQNILDESFMRGPADLIQAIEDPARYGESYLKDQLSSFVPFSVGLAQMARAADPYSRQARSVMDTIKAKVPFESQTLLPRRDIWGDEIANKPAVLAAGITAIYEQRMSRDPVNLALLDLGIYPAQVTRKIRNVQLTDQQYDDYQRIAGRMAKMRLDAIVNSPDYATWPNHIKANVIRETIAQSREAARGMMLMKSPQIARDAVQLRLSKVSGD